MKQAGFNVKMSLKQVLIVSLLVCNISDVLSEESDCSINERKLEKNGFILYGKTIEDVHNGMIETFVTQNVESMQFQSSKYIQFINEQFTTKTTNEYKNYEENETNETLSDVIDVKCANGKTYNIRYSQTIKDTNNHKPKFSSENYEFVIYSQLPNGFDFGHLSDVHVTDEDLTQDYMSFNVESNNDSPAINIQLDYKEGKKLFAKIRTSRVLTPPYEETFKISATDSILGSNRKTYSTITLKLKTFEDQKISFTKPSYKGKINKGQIKLDEDIQLVNGVDKDAKFLITNSDYANYFKATSNLITNSINIKLIDDLPEVPTKMLRSTKNIRFDLVVQWHEFEAITRIELVNDQQVADLCWIKGLDFDSDYTNKKHIQDDYMGVVQEFNDMLNVKDVSCSGNKYLKCTFDNNNNNKLIIKTTDDFANYENEQHSTMMTMNMTIKCPYEDHKIIFRQFIQDVNSHPPTFNENVYEFVLYNSLRKFYDLTRILPIITRDLDISTSYMRFSIESSDLFDVSSSVNVEKKEARPILKAKRVIDAPFDVTLLLTANDGKNSAHANLHIKLIANPYLFEFASPNYAAFIENGQLIFDRGQLRLLNGFDDDTKFSIAGQDYANFLNINSNLRNNSITILCNDFNNITLNPSYNTTPIQVEAFWQGSTCKTSITLINKPQQTYVERVLQNFDAFVLSLTITQILFAAFITITLISAMLYITVKPLAAQKEKQPV